jgi:hypothetical protein
MNGIISTIVGAVEGTTKGELDLIKREGTLKLIRERRDGAFTRPSIGLCKNTKLASTLLSVRDKSPSLFITGL